MSPMFLHEAHARTYLFEPGRLSADDAYNAQ